jgi:hypothetical protein
VGVLLFRVLQELVEGEDRLDEIDSLFSAANALAKTDIRTVMGLRTAVFAPYAGPLLLEFNDIVKIYD